MPTAGNPTPLWVPELVREAEDSTRFALPALPETSIRALCTKGDLRELMGSSLPYSQDILIREPNKHSVASYHFNYDIEILSV